jgi:hypothetical protein
MAGVPLNTIRSIFVTHHHSDHNARHFRTWRAFR